MAGFENKLIVVYHGAITVPDDQALSYIVFDVSSLYSRVQSQPLPLTPKSELRWLGFTDEGSVCTADSSGMLRILVNSTIWQPICNLDAQTKNKLDHYFVIGVSEKLKNIRGLLCKGAIYPRPIPKPIVSEISWKIPLCEADIEKGQLEDKLWQLMLIQRNVEALQDVSGTYSDTKKTIGKDILSTGLKLFALACRNDLEMRALEICEMIGDPVFVNLAIKYVENKGKTSLVNRLSQLDFRRSSKRERSPSPVFHRQNHFSSLPRKPLVEPSPVNLPNKDDLSQDVFGEENDENREENLILAYKKRKAAESLSTSSITPKGLNPFKKKNMNGDNEGLDALDKVTKKEPPVVKNNFSFDKKLSSRKMKKDSEATKANKKPTFLEWFENEKANLQEEFPELDLPDLTKTAMKRYKVFKSDSQISISSQSSTKETRDLKSFFTASSDSSALLDDSQKTTMSDDLSEV